MQIWGHRGAYSNAPENTLAGFLKAVEMGADGVEFDIQLSKDAEVVVIHDETIDRTSNGSGKVADFTLSELKKFNFNKRGVTSPFFMEIPTLSEVLELLAPTDLTLNIEFKTGFAYYEGIEKKAFDIVARFGISERAIWSSFNHFSVQNLKRFAPAAKTALLCGSGIIVTGEQCEKIGAYALHPQINQLSYPGLVEDCHKRGINVHAWTVTTPKQLDLARELGVDAVVVNDLSLKELGL